MKILDIQEFNTSPISSEESVISLGNTQTVKNIDGCYLELCIKISGKYLVFMTDDIPNEEMLNVYLLSEDLNVIDSATIGSIYSTGSFKDYSIKEPNTLTFHFIGETEWKLEVLDNKEFLLPFFSLPKGVSRKNMFYQYFRINGNPQSEVK